MMISLSVSEAVDEAGKYESPDGGEDHDLAAAFASVVLVPSPLNSSVLSWSSARCCRCSPRLAPVCVQNSKGVGLGRKDRDDNTDARGMTSLDVQQRFIIIIVVVVVVVVP